MKDRIFIVSKDTTIDSKKRQMEPEEFINMLKLYGWQEGVDLFVTEETSLAKLKPEIQEKVTSYVLDKEISEFGSVVSGVESERKIDKICLYGISGGLPHIGDKYFQEITTSIDLPDLEGLIIIPSNEPIYNELISWHHDKEEYKEFAAKLIILPDDERKRMEVILEEKQRISPRHNDYAFERLKYYSGHEGNEHDTVDSQTKQTIPEPKNADKGVNALLEIEKELFQTVLEDIADISKSEEGVVWVQLKKDDLIRNNSFHRALQDCFKEMNVVITTQEQDKMFVIMDEQTKNQDIRLAMFHGLNVKTAFQNYIEMPRYQYPERKEFINKVLTEDLIGLENIASDTKYRRVYNATPERKQQIFSLKEDFYRKEISAQLSKGAIITLNGKEYPNITKWLRNGIANQEKDNFDGFKVAYFEFKLDPGTMEKKIKTDIKEKWETKSFGITFHERVTNISANGLGTKKLSDKQLLDIKIHLISMNMDKAEELLGFDYTNEPDYSTDIDDLGIKRGVSYCLEKYRNEVYKATIKQEKSQLEEKQQPLKNETKETKEEKPRPINVLKRFLGIPEEPSVNEKQGKTEKPDDIEH